MSVLVFGRSGQVARTIGRIAPDAILLGRSDADLEDPESCRAAIHAHPQATAVMNAAAWTDVDAAEAEPDRVFRINGAAPGVMAEAARDRNIPFIQISTDYVFSGEGDAPNRPADQTAPLSVYGMSKRQAEERIRASGAVHAIIRSSWVFSGFDGNFVTTMLRLSSTRDRIDVVDDQIGGPTPATDLAHAVLTVAGVLSKTPYKSGTYHYAGAPEVSWASFAREVFALSGRSTEVRGIPSAEYPTAAARPLNSRLDCSATEAVFGLARPDWRAGLDQVLSHITAGEGEAKRP